MDEREFRNEIHKYIDESYDRYLYYRSIVLDIFLVFHKICKKHGIKYYYAFGSLLGAIRDNCMIPWDADIDVAIPICDIDILIDALKMDLPNDYYIVSNFTNKKYPLCQLRVCNQKYDSDIVHVDVFYLIGSPNDVNKRIKFQKKVKKVFLQRFYRNETLKKGSTAEKKVLYYCKKIIQFILNITSNRNFENKCKKYLFKYNYKTSDYCIVWACGTEIFPTNVFADPIIYETKEFECLIPNKSDVFLKIRYGNYHEYLPIKSRFNEFYGELNRLEGAETKNGQ